jgi:molybdate transport system ATP-binding protein
VLIITTRPEELPTHITHLLHIDDCKVARAGRRGLGKPHYFKLSAAVTSQEKAAQTNDSPHPGKHALVQLRRVTVRYGTRLILNQLSWTIFAGESWALLGPNGSGKSTLLSLILGDNPQAYMNEVIVFGQRRGAGESIWEIKKKIGWVSPELQLHFDDNISCSDAVISGFYQTIGLFERPTARQRKAAHKWLARFQLLRHADSLLCEMSAGLQRMVLLARALVKSPRLLILDEPCQGLDEPHRTLFLKTIDGLIRDDSVTAIYVTHRADEIPSSIKRIKRLSIE